jgi:hypothetical protein
MIWTFTRVHSQTSVGGKVCSQLNSAMPTLRLVGCGDHILASLVAPTKVDEKPPPSPTTPPKTTFTLAVLIA